MAAKKKKAEEYTADKIEVLEGLEAVRVRPGMYIGTTDKAGLHHLVYEIADNSIDEALAGYCTHVTVSIEKDGSCMVQDNGRGMPVDKHPKLGIPAVEVIHTVLHAGGKFGGGGYKVSGGLHGVGASVVNALSEKMIVEVSRNEKKYKIEFSKGKTTSKLKKTGTSKKSGSKTQFWPDPEIFDSIEFDYDTLRKRFKEAAFLTKGLKITVQDKRKGKEKKENFCYTGGLKEFVKELNDGKGPIARDIFYCEEANEDLSVEVAMQYTKKYSSNMMSYANCIMTPEGGTHLSGFKSALTRAVNDFARSKKILKKNDDALTGDDVREGVTAVISVKLGNPQFEGQTKTKLGNSEVKGFVSAAVYKNLSEYFRDNDALARKIAGKCIKAAKAREAAKKARDLARKKNAAASATTLPGKLADCSSKKAKECEIFIVEGEPHCRPNTLLPVIAGVA